MTADRVPTSNGASRPKLDFDVTVAHQARMYDFYLGGKDNFAADRAAAEAWLEVYPDMQLTARANRAFLSRAVGYLAREAGIRQFLDIGTGLPAAGNTHQVAQAIAPASRVVYVDYDPIVLAHARALLTGSTAGATEYIDADLRDTGSILAQAADLLDFTQPVAITLLAILHTFPDAEDPYGIVATLLDAVPPGSYLVLSHIGSDLLKPGEQQGLEEITGKMIRQQFTYRNREQVTRFFAGTDLVEPGIVPFQQWRPEPGAEPAGKTAGWCGMGRKR